MPTDKDLADKLGSTYNLWVQIQDFVFEKYPNGIAEWNSKVNHRFLKFSQILNLWKFEESVVKLFKDYPQSPVGI